MAAKEPTEGCCGSTAIRLTRYSTLLVVVIGLALSGYSIYLLVQSHAFSIVSGSILAFGLIDALIGVAVAIWGVNSRCCLDMWFWGFGLITIAQTVVAILFFIPGTRDSILSEIKDPTTLKLMKDNATPVGIGLLVAMGVQVVSILSSGCRKAQLADRVDDKDLAPRQEHESSRARLLDSSGGSAAGKSDREAARDRYKQSKAGYYEKYGDMIKR
ncbi:hypothetical protein FNF29_06257 [Cafeteria roenbergensis]|uniref:Uncharacterized protein n=1 Tax=Cafeteria roenbergensis TaxID=33653 RepID=A0A5A8C7H9_CAFRO|nr:hypothetical protein FNF29_06257 [Cafeteria roenbergensis]KAA0160087.1 hypothetical protein FNF31_04553 [Cafeteria roenbergensis]|eukprot:KAA0148973.1 hypothetical protein FNF29_06257 [Cafeteria roenbergensis]